MCYVFCAVWVDAVWEAEFCDAEKLDSVIEEKITEGGRNLFKTVHTELLPFSNDITENAQVFCSAPLCKSVLF